MTTERNLRRTVLPNGLIVLTERMEHLRSVAMGVWIKSGSRGEPAETIEGLTEAVARKAGVVIQDDGTAVDRILQVLSEAKVI